MTRREAAIVSVVTGEEYLQVDVTFKSSGGAIEVVERNVDIRFWNKLETKAK